jgi:hypothetical protein
MSSVQALALVISASGCRNCARDHSQSIFRFRRADLKVYEDVRALVLRCGGAVLPLTTVEPLNTTIKAHPIRSARDLARFLNAQGLYSNR